MSDLLQELASRFVGRKINLTQNTLEVFLDDGLIVTANDDGTIWFGGGEYDHVPLNALTPYASNLFWFVSRAQQGATTWFPDHEEDSE